MNEIQIFKNKDFGEIKVVKLNGKIEYLVDGEVVDRFRMLASAVESDTEEIAWEILNLASKLFHPLDDISFNILYGCVAMDIARKWTKNERYYQNLFNEKYSKIYGGRVVKHKTNNKDIPDSWVLKDDNLIPVEVKLSNFDKKALTQLERYVSVYNTISGIAVARNLTVELPHNITFISFKELEEV